MKKKIVVALFLMGMFTGMASAENLTQKRIGIARRTKADVDAILAALNDLNQCKIERSQLSDGNFNDSEFTGDLQHITAGMMGTMLDFVAPSLQTTADTTQNKQIMNQIK